MKKENKFAIVGGTLIDGTGQEPVENTVILIEGSRIVDIGRRNVVRIPEGFETIEASDLTIMPGLIDCHVHLTGCRGKDPLYWMGLVEPKPLRAMRAVTDAWKVLDAGFTTVRDMGSLNAIYLKKVIEEGLVAGPRIIACGRALGRTGGHGDLRRDIYELPEQFVSESLSFAEICDGVDSVRRAVRKLIGLGADCIKFFASGGGSWEKDRMEDQHFTLEEMKAIVDEAHMAGMKVAAHAEGLKGAKAAVEVGVDTIEHGDVLDEEVCKEMVRKNIILVPTISVYYVGPWAAWEVQQKSFKIARSVGVKIALGSDAFVEDWTSYGTYNIGEIKKLVDWGMSPMEAIMSATKIGAEALGIEDKVGTLEKGKLADILLVKGNPLEDITVLLDKKNIQTIIKEGRIMRRYE